MPDTQRSTSDLLDLLADNTAGNISPQDLRDVLVSLLGGYGSIYVEDGAVAQTVNIAAAKLTGFAANGESSSIVPDHGDDELNVPVAGTYWVEGHFSFSGTAAGTFQLRLRKQGVEVAGIGCRAKLNATGDAVSVSFAGLVACAAADILTVYAEADADASSLTLIDGALVAKRVG